MLRLETEFIPSDLKFSHWDDKGLIGINADTFQTKYVGQLNYWRMNEKGQLDELQSVVLNTGGVIVRESTQYNSFLYTGHTDPILRLWTLNELRKPIKRYSYHTMGIEDLDVSPFNGEEFVSSSKDSSFAVWTTTESEPQWASTNDSNSPMLAAAYHPQNPSLLIAAPLDAKLEMWNLQDRKKVYTVTPPDDIIFSSLSISPYNEYLMSMTDENGYVYLWDLRKLKKPLRYWQAHSLSIPQIKFNPHDEKLLGTGGTDTYFHLWYLESEEDMGNKSQKELNTSASTTSTILSNESSDLFIDCLKTFKTHTLPITTWDWSIHELGLLGDAGADYSIFLWNFVDDEEDDQKGANMNTHQNESSS